MRSSECAYTYVHIMSPLTGRKGGASLQYPLFSQEEGAALNGSLYTEILHQSGRSLPGPAEKRNLKKKNNLIYLVQNRHFQTMNV